MVLKFLIFLVGFVISWLFDYKLFNILVFYLSLVDYYINENSIIKDNEKIKLD